MNQLKGAILLLVLPAALAAQVRPKEGGKLNYRLVGFSVPKNARALTYKLEIAKGDQTSQEAFDRNIIISAENRNNRIIAELPAFGESYTWQMTSVTNSSKPVKSTLHHFSTLKVNEVDTTQQRVRIVQQAEAYNDGYFFLNANNTLYDMEGHPLWFLPRTDKLSFGDGTIRDIKLTSRGTLTFVVAGNAAYEIDYDGNVLWKAPNTGIVSGDTTEYYNHEFTRLTNGHYLISGTMWYNPVPRPTKNGPPPPPAGMRVPPPGQMPGGPRHTNHRQAYGTLIEYDEKGKVVWSWKSDAYFKSADLEYFPNNLRMPMNDVHQNSFWFDEKNKVIYISYKHVHRVLKIKYPEGTVLSAYGEKYYPGKNESGTGLYCFQHAIKKSDKGELYLYNNNSCHPDQVPQILVMNEPAVADGELTVKWKFDFPVNTLLSQFNGNRIGEGDQTVGGNVMELPDGSFFASMCSPYSDLFIVNRDKKITWHGVVDRWDSNDNKWIMQFQYRAFLVPDRKSLEKFVWSNESKTN